MHKEFTNCPRCNSEDIRISYSTKILDCLAKWLLDRVPFRCRKCRLRFYCPDQHESTLLKEAAAVRLWTGRLRKRRE